MNTFFQIETVAFDRFLVLVVSVTMLVLPLINSRNKEEFKIIFRKHVNLQM
jgi:hypothetical protein